jgi:hypothetical protein
MTWQQLPPRRLGGRGHAPSRRHRRRALYFTPDAFEAYDAKGNVAASGDWEAASAIASRRSVSLAALTGE